MSTPNDLQALLASIRPRPSPSNAPGHDQTYPRHQPAYHPGLFPPHPQQQPYEGQSFPHPQPHGYHHPTVSSTLHSPSPVNTPPHHGSDIISPNVPTPRADWQQQQQPQYQQYQQYQQQPPPQSNNPDRAANLLSLLRFSQGPGGISAQPIPAAAPEQSRSPLSQESSASHGRNISASDLVASLFNRQAAAAAPAAAPAEAPPAQQSGPSENTQEMLLRLLNRPQPGAEVEAPGLVATSQSIPPSTVLGSPDVQETEKALLEVVESIPEGPAKPETVASPGTQESKFTYINPFEQLAAVSPRTKSPQPKSAEEVPAVGVTKKEKINVTTNFESSPAPEMPKPQMRNESPVLNNGQREAVHEVVGRLVGEIGRSLSGSEASILAPAEPSAPVAKEEESQAMLSSIASHLRESSIEATQDDLKKSTKAAPKGAADTAVPPSRAPNGNEQTEALADSWESAEDSAEKEEERIVSVQNFPLKPFISIAVKAQAGKLVTFRDDGVMDIARLKKEFDQLDRSLTAATPEYIVYALAKNGGIRIIRQDDGSDRQVFRSTRDRVFNVAVCSSPSSSGASDVQAILGIGVSGAVYWALISRTGKDLFDLDALESESLIFPPFPASDENTSGGQLKTRAKRSTRHPELFAIGRGKNIYVVSPQAAMSPSYGVTASQRTVNTEKFFKERALKISTGKAGKDFAFSDDDTVIASLDKTGRLRFWDIRDVLGITNSSTENPPSEVRVPLNTFVTGSPAEKSWPTSVLFLDKLRAYSRSMALRYVLVGLKQNHTLQLWDIGLGKAVEELKFPHENESDAICSVAYHPSSGIIVVGHPTRNSIYFVHLSAPRYNLPQMSQAQYIKAASEKDSSLPKPESTACLSGIREISLAPKGQLRSLELLSINKSTADKHGAEEEAGLFELYVMHSRGVTCLNIKKEDLGWTSDNKVARPVDALAQGSIEITDLQSFPSYITDEPSVNGDTAPIARTMKDAGKKPDTADSSSGLNASRTASPTKLAKKQAEEQPEPAAAAGGTEKPDKKKKRKAVAEMTIKAKEPSATAGVEPLPAKDQPKESDSRLSSVGQVQTPDRAASVHQHLPSPSRDSSRATPTQLPRDTPTQLPRDTSTQLSRDIPTHLARDTMTNLSRDNVSEPARDTMAEQIENTLSVQFDKILSREFQTLYQRFDDDRRSWDAASIAKQDKVLRLISSTLSNNVENSLTRIITENIQSEVVPTVTDITSKAVGKQIDDVVSQKLDSTLGDQLRQALPKAITSALQQPAVMKAVADAVAQKLAPRIEAEVFNSVQSSLSPMMENLVHGFKKMESDMEEYFNAQAEQYEAQRETDREHRGNMVAMLQELTNMVAGVAAHQRRQTEQATTNRSSLARSAEPAGRASHQPVAQATPTQPPVSAEDAELAEITNLMHNNQIEEATIKVCFLCSL